MAGGANCWVNGLQKRARGWGSEGWGQGVGQGGGVRGWVKGVEFIFKWSFLQNRYRYFRLGCHNSRYDTKSYRKSWGIPDFGGIPIVMTSHSWKHVIISPKKSPKTRRQEISPNYLCKKEQPSWKSEYVGSLWIFKLKYFINEWTPGLDISTRT